VAELSEPDAPLAGTTIAAGEGLVAAVAAWWCASLGAKVVVTDPAAWATGTFQRRTANCSIVDPAGVPADAVAIGGARPAGGNRRVAISDPSGSGDDQWRSMALWARSGLASITRGVWTGDAVGQPQVPMVAATATIAGSLAALSAIALLLGGDRPDREIEIDEIEIDELECLCLLPMQPVAAAQLSRELAVDPHNVGFFEAKDGLVYIRAVEPMQWQRLLARVPGLEATGDAIASDPLILRDELARIDDELAPWVREQAGLDVVDLGQGVRAPVAMIAAPSDVLSDRQLVARSFVIDRDGLRSVRAPWLVTNRSVAAGPPPRPDIALRPRADLPLNGVRVLDLSWAWAGPFATTLLADLGAEVINVEWLPRPSNLRVQAPFAGERGVDSGGWWSANQRNKLSIGVDMKSDLGRDIVYELAAVSDIAIENFAAGVVDRLGVGFEELSARNPQIVYVSMSAYGASGPSSHFVGYGTQLYAAAGFSYLTSPDGATPSMMGIPIPDPISGIAAAVAALAHLYNARRTGYGIEVDVSELEATCICLLEGLVDEVTAEPYDVVESEGRWRVRQGPHAEPVATVGESLHDDWLIGRQFWMNDPNLSRVVPNLKMAAPPFVVNGRRAPVWRGAPALFADTEAVLRDLLGWDRTRIAEALQIAGTP
jgi:crotonobetainyl-CoA:carnitine CoA-transferase CaiB-like acyl-CoA transferase